MSLNGQIKHNYLLEHVRARWNPRDPAFPSQQPLNMIIIIIPFVKEIPDHEDFSELGRALENSMFNLSI